MTYPTRKCKRTGKIGFTSEVDARIKAYNAGSFYDKPMRVYLCPHCRLYHTSRVKPRADQD